MKAVGDEKKIHVLFGKDDVKEIIPSLRKLQYIKETCTIENNLFIHLLLYMLYLYKCYTLCSYYIKFCILKYKKNYANDIKIIFTQ